MVRRAGAACSVGWSRCHLGQLDSKGLVDFMGDSMVWAYGDLMGSQRCWPIRCNQAGPRGAASPLYLPLKKKKKSSVSTVFSTHGRTDLCKIRHCLCQEIRACIVRLLVTCGIQQYISCTACITTYGATLLQYHDQLSVFSPF